MFCTKCGAEINDSAVVCVNCGCAVGGKQVVEEEKDMTVSVGLVIVSVLIPLFGIIYWPVKAKTRPKCAQACGIAGIISWVVSFLLMMLMNL